MFQQSWKLLLTICLPEHSQWHSVQVKNQSLHQEFPSYAAQAEELLFDIQLGQQQASLNQKININTFNITVKNILNGIWYKKESISTPNIPE
jgi:hypothetical protein